MSILNIAKEKVNQLKNPDVLVTSKAHKVQADRVLVAVNRAHLSSPAKAAVEIVQAVGIETTEQEVNNSPFKDVSELIASALSLGTSLCVYQ